MKKSFGRYFILFLILSSCGDVNSLSEKDSFISANVSEVETESIADSESPSITSSQESIIKDDSLIARWEFDKIERYMVYDVSGNYHDAIVCGEPDIVNDGNTSYVSLSKTGDNLVVTDDGSLNFKKEDSFTVEARFRWSGKKGTSWPCLFNKGLYASTNDYKYYGIWIDPSNNHFNFGITSIPEGGCRNIDFGLADNNWHTIIMVQNGATKSLEMFVDETFVSKLPSINCDSATGMFIGFNGEDINGSQFFGDIDYIAVYGEAKEVDIDRPESVHTVDEMEYKTYTIHSDILKSDVAYKYRLYLPSDYNSSTSKKYPVLLFLHGHGECGTDNEQQIRILGDKNELLDKVVARDDTIVIAPQAPHSSTYIQEIGQHYSTEWVSFGEQWNQGSRSALPQYPALGNLAAWDILNSYLDNGKCDLNRVYISGLSMGGYGTWEMITRHPDTFAAAIPVCGGGFPSLASTIKDIPIWAFHGLVDRTVTCKGTQDMETALKAVGGNIKATYYAGVDHDSWKNAFAEKDLITWLYSQSK